ncbi:MAG: hypothetical protein IJG13_15215 [Kiritimatiellae bacterium]|nr:hypothetical protein [Kiritimatiellia bacterium]MBQ3342051.1 hypothetical protein [Kiritimatiellia bacterium]
MNTRCYRSKIGRLPFAIRNELNERIRDGALGSDILVWLNGLKETKKVMRELKTSIVNAQNLTDWRSTGYKDWLEDQNDADRIRRLAEVSQTLAAAAGGNVAGVGCSIATAKIMDALESADDDKIADLSTALVKLRASENAAQKVALAEEKNAIQKEQLELNRAKFERDTTRLFIKWAQSKDAIALATDKRLGSDEKTERLGRLMFGDLWESDK